LVRGNKDGTTGVHWVISVIERRVRELENGAIQVFGLVAILFGRTSYFPLQLLILDTKSREYSEVIRVQEVEAIAQANHRGQHGDFLAPSLQFASSLGP
jgi:hypothetical protein